MKYLKGLCQLISGILFILLPVVIFYWSLTLVNLEFIKPLVAVLASFIDPILAPVKPYILYAHNYETFSVDYTILIFAGLLLILAFVFVGIGNIFDFIDELIDEIKLKLKKRELIKRKEEERQEYLNELGKNKTIYVILKLIKNTPKESYLIKDSGEDFFSVGLVDSYENSLSDLYKKFFAKYHGHIGDYNDTHGYIFNDINRFLSYLNFFAARVEEVNKGMLDLNIKFDYKIACHCSISDASADVDFEITSKILNLSGNREILLSELLKSRLEIMEKSENNQFKLLSRGIYLIKDKQIDVFKLQYD